MRDLVVFDFDGTLADTWRDIATGLNRMLREAGLPAAEPADVRAWVGHGVRRLIGRAGRLPDDGLQRGGERMHGLCTKRWRELLWGRHGE